MHNDSKSCRSLFQLRLGEHRCILCRESNSLSCCCSCCYCCCCFSPTALTVIHRVKVQNLLQRRDDRIVSELLVSFSVSRFFFFYMSLSLFLPLSSALSLCVCLSFSKLIWSLAQTIIQGVKDGVGAPASIFWCDINIA